MIDIGDASGIGTSRSIPSVSSAQKKPPLGEATEVDHIVPLRDGGAMYDEANLQGLCKSHLPGERIPDRSEGEDSVRGRFWQFSGSCERKNERFATRRCKEDELYK